MKKIITVFVLAVLSLTQNYSFCQSDDSLKTYKLEDVVVTATRFETDLKSSPNKVEIIDFDQIINSNGNRLPDILNNSSSVFIKSYGISSSLKTISLNGLGAEHTIILVDGVKINSFQNGQIDLSLIPKDNIERIEIVNNGMSSIYGSEAVGGTINIITNYNNRFNPENDLSIKGSMGFGSFNTLRYGLSAYKSFNDLAFNVFYNKETSDGNFNYYFNDGINNNLKQRENAAYNLHDVGINSQIFLDTYSRLTFYSTYSSQDKQVPGIETGTPPSKTNQKDQNWNNIISFEKTFSDQFILKTVFNFQNNLMHYEIKPLTKSYYKNIVASFAPELNIKLKNFDLITGYDYSYANLNSNEVEGNSRRNQHALFISSGTDAINSLNVFTSARFDHFSDLKKNALTARFGLNYKPFSEIDLNLRASIGNNFRAPTFNDLYWKQSGNPNLKPEQSYNFETGFIGSIDFLTSIRYEFTYTYINAKDKIVWMPQRNLLWSPVNIAASKSNNFLIDFSFNKQLSEAFKIRFNFGINLINSKKTNESFKDDLSKDKYIPYIPLQSLKLGFIAEYKIIGLNLFYTHTGERFSDFENTDPMNPSNILDGNISIKLNIWQIDTIVKFEANNITNADYQIISGYPMPLRNYFLTLSINY